MKLNKLYLLLTISILGLIGFSILLVRIITNPIIPSPKCNNGQSIQVDGNTIYNTYLPEMDEQCD